MDKRWLAALSIAGLTLAGPAAAAPTGARASPDQPIEITADALEVLQKDQVAVFSGNVDAVQGDIRLRADKVRVHYRTSEQKPPPPKGARPGPAAKPTAASDGANAISRIDASGRVFVSSPQETAHGDTGLYDLDNRKIFLEGKVLLTRGESVLRGNRAVMDLDTGRSTMLSAPGERVRGLFTPGQAPAPGPASPRAAAPGGAGQTPLKP
jgi:lipopolysaccharide export system protein LptA